MAAAEAEGGLWRPAGRDDILRFEKAWCHHCVNRFRDGEPWDGESPDGPMCMESWEGDFPHELRIRDGEPHCTAFTGDPERPMRCPFTAELNL